MFIIQNNFFEKVYPWAYFRPPSILFVSRQGTRGYTLSIFVQTLNTLNFCENKFAHSCKKYCQLSTLSIGQRCNRLLEKTFEKLSKTFGLFGQKCKRLLAKTFEKLLKNETNTLPKSLIVSSVKKKLLKEKIISMFVEET